MDRPEQGHVSDRIEMIGAQHDGIDQFDDSGWAVASAVRQALRRAGKDRREIDLFLAEVMATDDPQALQETCNRWVNLKPLTSN